MNLTIREEIEQDHDAIREIHRMAFGGAAEGRLVDDLRRTDAVAISLVAEHERRIIGHVLFSKLEAPMSALSLAPVGVHPSFQSVGVGSTLIRRGLTLAEERGWAAVFVLGEPSYYGRFGFSVEAARGYACPYSGAHFMVTALAAVAIPLTGQVKYPAPFSNLD